jgi:hypothetical protein
MTKNEFCAIFNSFDTTKVTCSECSHYSLCYYKHFSELLNSQKVIKILEFGVDKGQSLLMWNRLFANSEVVGVDNKEDRVANAGLICADMDITVVCGDQSNISFLSDLIDNFGKFDIIIDDASHISTQQITCFEYMFEHGLLDSGLYVIEDLGTSYWSDWCDGETTMIKYLQKLVDSVNHRFWKHGRINVKQLPGTRVDGASYLEENVTSICFHRGICFVQKGNNF